MEPKTRDEAIALLKYRSSSPLTKDEIMTLQRLRKTSLLCDEDSPVPPEARQKGFRGTGFFPIDLKYQLKLKVQGYENPEPIQLSLSNGGKDGEDTLRLRAGYFVFELEGKNVKLHAYKKRAADTEMFLPFKDKTSGIETYGAGRYLNLYGDSDGNYIIDFNLAYNPQCAFDDKKYACPLPPAENWLTDVEIRAGELKFEGT